MSNPSIVCPPYRKYFESEPVFSKHYKQSHYVDEVEQKCIICNKKLYQ